MAKKKAAAKPPAKKKPTPKKADKHPQIEAYRWPEGVPITTETLQQASEEFNIYVEGYNLPVVEDDDETEWDSVDLTYDKNKLGKECERNRIRELVKAQPNARRAIALYEIYVLVGFKCRLVPRDPEQSDLEKKIIRMSEQASQEFLQANSSHWSVPEFGRRIYRDGEQFTRKFADTAWPPQVRFIDPENIADEDKNEPKGIVTDPEDVASVLAYKRYDHDDGKVAEEIPADRVIHTKIDVDSTEKRGRSRLASCRIPVCLLRGTIRNEVYLRNAQSSIVLVRKVAGGSGTVNRVTDNAKTSVTEYREGSINREKFRPGTVLTVSKGMEVQFAQPDSNFSDARPLIKTLMEQICAATGWSYTMISADSTDTNLAAGLVAESPVTQMVMTERSFCKAALTSLFTWVFETWVQQKPIEGVTPESLWEEWMLDMEFDPVVTRDHLKENQASNIALMGQGISRREFSRRVGADPDQMRKEIEEESKLTFYNPGNNGQAMNPDAQDKKISSASNATNGSGTNQGGPA